MASFSLEVFTRQEAGKGVARKLRRAGLIPAVLYGHKSVRSLAVRLADLQTVLKSEHGSNSILEIAPEGAKKTVLLKDIQFDPIRREPIHVDLFEVSMDQKIRVMVEIKSTGADPVGFKKGGILTHTLTSVEVECLPLEIPDAFEADLSSLDVGDAFHVSDLPDVGVKILTPGDQVLFNVVAPTLEKAEEEEVAEGAEGEEAATPEEKPKEATEE